MNLAEALPKEQARVREVLGHYRDIGHHGAFGTNIIELTLKKADEAIASGDIVAMMKAYQELKKVE